VNWALVLFSVNGFTENLLESKECYAPYSSVIDVLIYHLGPFNP